MCLLRVDSIIGDTAPEVFPSLPRSTRLRLSFEHAVFSVNGCARVVGSNKVLGGFTNFLRQ